MLEELDQGYVCTEMPDSVSLQSGKHFTEKTSVAFQRPDFAVFRLSKADNAENPLRVTLVPTPAFIVPPDAGYGRWWGSLKATLARTKVSRNRINTYPLRADMARRGYFRGRSWTMSLGFHAAAVLLILYAHQQFPDSVSAFDSTVPQPEVIYYRVPVQQLPKTLPHIAPPGPGGRPLTGRLPALPAAAGSTTSQNVLTMVTKAARPDNSHQTIIQPNSPPDLKITADLKLPNIILGKPIEAPKAPLQFNPTAAKPVEKDHQTSAEPAPTLNSDNSPSPVMALLTPSAFKPSMPVPVASGAAQRRTTSGSGNVQAPNITATSGDSATLAVISTDPAGASGADIMLPPGNRYGEFSTSATENAAGTPGGDRSGVVGGGSGNTGKGGDGSTGPGKATSGGGGVLLAEGPVTISGAGTNSSGSGLLGAALAQGIVYPVPTAFNIRKNSLVISAGPIGGGGLNAYGALTCGRIYTIFLPMPGKNWTMQYCVQDAPKATATNEPPTVAHFGEGVVPPQADAKFDFKRSPVPIDKVGKQIILKGILRADGLIDALEVYESVLPEMDDNARLAFSQWKFKPALRDGKPTPVEVLVGIPATVPSAAPAQ